MYIVYMHVESLFACERFTANMAKIVVYLAWQAGPFPPFALLHVVDEPHQVLRLQHLLADGTAVLLCVLVPMRTILQRTFAVNLVLMLTNERHLRENYFNDIYYVILFIVQIHDVGLLLLLRARSSLNIIQAA